MPSPVLIFAVEVLVIQLGQQYFIKLYKYAGLAMILELKSNLFILFLSLCYVFSLLCHIYYAPFGCDSCGILTFT